MQVLLQDNIVVAVEKDGIIDLTIPHNKVVELEYYNHPIEIGWIYQNPEVPEGVSKKDFAFFFDPNPPPLVSKEVIV